MTPTKAPINASTSLTLTLETVLSIAESPFNQRKSYSDSALKEMAESIRQEGIIQPLIARPHPKPKGSITHELVVGSRRLRAAKMSGLHTVPCIVRNYSDAQVQAIQMIENDQREDVSDMERAAGYKILLDTPGYTLDIIAEKIGKDAPFVHKRISLLRLIPEIQTLLNDNELNIGHALELSRLPEAGQRLMLERYLVDMSRGQHVTGLGFVETGPSFASLPVLRAAIQREVFMNLEAAPWNKDVSITLPSDDVKVGGKIIQSCSTCPERSGANAVLFPDMAVGKEEVCLNAQCYREKGEAHLIQITRAKEIDGVKLVRLSTIWSPSPELKARSRSNYHEITAKSDRCASAVEGIFVDGATRAQTTHVCIDQSCKKHGSKVSSSSSSSGSSEGLTLWEKRENKLPQTIEWESRKAIVEAILEKPVKWNIPHEQLQVIALALLPSSINGAILDMLALPGVPIGEKRNNTETADKLREIIRSKKGTKLGDELPRVVVALSLQERIREFDYIPDAKKLLAEAGAAFQIDEKKVAADTAKSLRDEFKAKRSAAEAKKTVPAAAPKEPKASAKKPAPVAKKAAKKKAVKK